MFSPEDMFSLVVCCYGVQRRNLQFGCMLHGLERRNLHIRWRPYRVECTGSLSTSEVKRHRARLVLGWGTAWEHPRVLPAFGVLGLVLEAATGGPAPSSKDFPIE